MSYSLSRQRAQFAFQQLRTARDRKELAGYLKGRPIQVRSLGLATTLALMMKDEKESAATTVWKLIVKWLTDDRCPTKALLDMKPDRKNLGEELLDWCLEADNASYRTVQAEAIALLDQAKILAAALEVASGERERPERTG